MASEYISLYSGVRYLLASWRCVKHHSYTAEGVFHYAEICQYDRTQHFSYALLTYRCQLAMSRSRRICHSEPLCRALADSNLLELYVEFCITLRSSRGCISWQFYPIFSFSCRYHWGFNLERRRHGLFPTSMILTFCRALYLSRNPSTSGGGNAPFLIYQVIVYYLQAGENVLFKTCELCFFKVSTGS